MWEFVSSEHDLEKLLLPFVIADGAEVGCRAGFVDISAPIDKIDRAQTVGFMNSEDSLSGSVPLLDDSDKTYYTTFSYNPNIQGWDVLCRRLLQYRNAVMVRLVLRPSLFSAEEKSYLESESARLYAIKNRVDSYSYDRNLFLDKLNTLISNISRRVTACQDKTFEVYSEIYSDKPLSQGLIEHLGSTLTRNPGDSGLKLEHFDSTQGGYDWLPMPRDVKLSQVVSYMNVTQALSGKAQEPYKRLGYLMTPQSAVGVFHLPFVMSDRSFPGVNMHQYRNIASTVPNTVATEIGRVIGENVSISGSRHKVKLSREDRRHHMYVVGQTGVGKTTMMEQMVLDDILQGEGVCLIDPHGDLADSVLNKIPIERAEDVVYLNPAMDERPIGINMLEYRNEREKLFVVQEIISMMERLFDDKYKSTVTGPIFYHNLRMGLLYVMCDNEPVTLLDLYRFFSVPDYYKSFDITQAANDPILQAYHKANNFDSFKKGNDVPFAWYIISKFDNFLGDPMVRNIICQDTTTIDFDEIIDKGKILIVNLAKGAVGEINSRFLGMLIVSKLQLAAMRRVKMPQNQRRDFYLYVDEFHNLATTNFSTLLSEARKFRLNLVLANQFRTQLPSDIADALQGNVGSTVIFRSGIDDAELFEKMTEPVFSKTDLQRLPNWTGVALLQHNGQPVPPFTLQTILHPQPYNSEIGECIQQLSAFHYGRDTQSVANDIRMNEEWRLAMRDNMLNGDGKNSSLKMRSAGKPDLAPF
ncbi:MAG: type IV secretion system DNA-binding domain-containing protein [Chlorobiales bacterium]|nr:type IV secretion system DNA-binding domain-containing protein [Chlorobiales bacterium]